MEAGMEHAAIDHHLRCECLPHKRIPFMGYDIFEPETLPDFIFSYLIFETGSGVIIISLLPPIMVYQQKGTSFCSNVYSSTPNHRWDILSYCFCRATALGQVLKSSWFFLP
jgi:hypothetical protein